MEAASFFLAFLRGKRYSVQQEIAPKKKNMQQITILIHCADQKGIIAAVTDFILRVEGNITYIDQHVDREQDVFFMRLECELTNKNSNVTAIKNVFEQSIAADFDMKWEIHTMEQKPKMALFVFNILLSILIISEF